ncbi:MAG: YceH family protein [Acidimicrobiia bacterium]
MELTAEAARVVGCLMEKERTVPDTYPLTLNSLVTACNQSSNRWPVVRYDPGTVQRTLDGLKADGMVRFVHPSHGERTTKYRQVLDEKLGLESDEAAVLCALVLRGPQTVSELRSRTERLHPFTGPGEISATLERLAGREDPLVRSIGRRAGEREGRWAHLLAGQPPASGEPSDEVDSDRASAGRADRDGAGGRADLAVEPLLDAIDALEARVGALERQVDRLYTQLGEEP